MLTKVSITIGEPPFRQDPDNAWLIVRTLEHSVREIHYFGGITSESLYDVDPVFLPLGLLEIRPKTIIESLE